MVSEEEGKEGKESTKWLYNIMGRKKEGFAGLYHQENSPIAAILVIWTVNYIARGALGGGRWAGMIRKSFMKEEDHELEPEE